MWQHHAWKICQLGNCGTWLHQQLRTFQTNIHLSKHLNPSRRDHSDPQGTGQSTVSVQRLGIQNAPMDMRRCNAHLLSHRCHIVRLDIRHHRWLLLTRLSHNVLRDSEYMRRTHVLTIALRGISCMAVRQIHAMQR